MSPEPVYSSARRARLQHTSTLASVIALAAIILGLLTIVLSPSDSMPPLVFVFGIVAVFFTVAANVASWVAGEVDDDGEY